MHNHQVSWMAHIKCSSSQKQSDEKVTSPGKTAAVENQSIFICAESSEVFLMVSMRK